MAFRDLSGTAAADARLRRMASSGFLENARRALTRSELPQFLTERRDRTAELRPLLREVSLARHQVRLNDSVPYYVDSPSPLEMRGLETRLAAKQAALRTVEKLAASKLKSCYSSSPPLEIVHRVEVVIGEVLAHTSIGAEPERLGATRLADELDRIAQRVADIWAPDVNLDTIVMTLRDNRKRWQISGGNIPNASHPTLGWAPIDHDTLLRGAAAVLQTSAFTDAERNLAQCERRVELAEREARQQGTGLIEGMHRWLDKGPSPDEQALFTAQETLFNGVENALNVFVPLGIHAMATAASAALRGAQGSWESKLCPATGALRRPRSRAARAIVLATLVELRASCERTFPGLPALLWTGNPDVMRAALDRTRGSPYRRRAAEPQSSPLPAGGQRAQFSTLEARGLEHLVARGVIHAARLGVIERRFGESDDLLSWADRATFWSTSEESHHATDLADRAAWHTRVLRQVEAQAVRLIEQARRGDPQVVLHEVIARAHAALLAVRTHHTSADHMPVIVGCPEALHALRQLAACFAPMYGLKGDRSYLVNAILRRLSGPTVARPHLGQVLSFPQVVDALAFHLQGTEFASLAPRIGAAVVERERLRSQFREAHLAVGVWDQINIFTDSDAEERRDDLGTRLQSVGAHIAAEIQQANVFLEGALATYPPASLYYGIPRLMHRIAQIPAGGHNSRGDVRYGAPSIKLKKPAVDALNHWTVCAIRFIGDLPTPSEVLEQYVAQDLEGAHTLISCARPVSSLG